MLSPAWSTLVHPQWVTTGPRGCPRFACVKRLVLASALGLALAFAACGESDEEKAQNKICDARDDIKTQVSELQDLTITSATTDKVKSHLNAIRDDFSEIADAQGDLNDKQSKVAKLQALPRAYALLQELNNRPRLLHLAKITNPHPELAGESAGEAATEKSDHGHSERH